MEIERELRSYFSSRVVRILFPCDINDQFIFLRAFIASGSSIVKVEVLQNMRRIDSVQSLSGLNVTTIRDIGLFKLLSCSSRASVKDVYDLDYVTNHIDHKEFIGLLKIKLDRDHGPKYHTIFDLNGLANPVEDPSLLLKFDKGNTASKNLPNHANNRILIQEGAKDWQLARISWRSKVRRLNKSMKI